MGCESGIFVAPVESNGASIFSLSLVYLWIRNIVTDFRLMLNYMHPTSLAAVTSLGRKSFNRLVVHVDSAVMTYSLDILARLALGKSQQHSLDASIERVGGNDVNIVLCRHIHFNKRALCSYIFSMLSISSSSPHLVIYGSKRRLGTSVTLHVVEALDSSEAVLSPTGTCARAFRPLGEVRSLSNHICSRSSELSDVV